MDDPTSEEEIAPHKIGHKGSRSLLLLNSLETIPTLPPDTETFDIRHNEVRTVNASKRPQSRAIRFLRLINSTPLEIICSERKTQIL